MAEETDPEPRKSSPHEAAGTRAAPVEVLRFKLATLGIAQIFTVVIAFATAPFVALPFHALLPEGYWRPFLVASFFVVPTMSLLVARQLVRRAVSIGADGILTGNRWSQRFIHYAQIRAVQHVLPVDGHLDVSGFYRVQVEVTGGETLDLPTWNELHESQGGRSAAHTNDPLGADLARVIKEARDAWASGRTDESLHEEVLARNGRSGAEWLAALRSLSAGASDVYRAVTIDAERLWRVLDQPGARPSLRVAAAVVLGASSDAPARRKLRVVARSMVDPELKSAIKRAAVAHDDDALIEALEAIEGREGRDRKAVDRA